jgi:hypothetical protein
LSDLEDTSLLIDGIGPDLISDITTNVIRGALIGYTQSACTFYGIDMEEQYCGFVWNPDELEWQEGQALLPRPHEDLLLLVPKSIVRGRLTVDSDKYYNRTLAPLLEQREIDKRSPLVEVLKNGRHRVPRRVLAEKYPASKLAIVKYTNEFPEALPRYKNSLTSETVRPMGHYELAARTGTPPPNFGALLEAVVSLPPGPASATVYHRNCADLLQAIFWPHLANMILEREIHEGRKRIDISFDNLAGAGTFFWLNTSYRTPTIPIECKNYSRDVTNPELDQIAGRFSTDRGFFGIIVFRGSDDKDLLLKRCRDTAKDGRGHIIALDDEDLRALVQERSELENESQGAMYKLIRERIDYLIT